MVRRGSVAHLNHDGIELEDGRRWYRGLELDPITSVIWPLICRNFVSSAIMAALSDRDEGPRALKNLDSLC